MPRSQLHNDNFDDETLKNWVSYVGGENEGAPTWKIHEGSLEQPIVDGLLRAILTGDSGWRDYAVQARVRIQSTDEGSRAGLVFRDDGRGFYVLRVARGHARAQLMYHSRAPFGWHELATVPLSEETVGPDWIELKAEVRGPYIRCFVGGDSLLDVSDSRSTQGRTGFYCCEAHACFDRFEVESRDALAIPTSPPYAPAQSFWFRETFTSADNPSWDAPDGWRIGGGVLYRPPDALNTRVARLNHAPITDGVIQVQLRLYDLSLPLVAIDMPELTRRALFGNDPPLDLGPHPSDGWRAGLLIRGQGVRYYALLLDRQGAQLSLVYRDDSHLHEEELARVEFKETPQDRWYSLVLQLKGDNFLGLLDGIPCIQASDSRMTSGYVGLYASGGPTMFTDLLAASGP